VSLETEIANAVRVLAAAGVRCRTGPPAPGKLAPDGERLLALVVREATTNILRHSTAADAAIIWSPAADRLTLSIRNDAPLPIDHGAKDGGNGGGLSGLAQRFASAGGRLTWQAEPQRFTLDAELPR
jgi:two-component system sensor histidine kinase DesK